MKIICFDIGKTKILAASARVGKKSYIFTEMAEYKNPVNPEKIKKIILDFCLAARGKLWTKKVAVSAAHLVDSENNVVSQGKICYGTDEFNFGFLEKEGFSIRIENDGRCFAMGESRFGKGRKATNILTMNLGTEIGGGCIVDGKSFRGSHNSAFEISNISANYLGKWTRWADLCAGKAIEKAYEKESGEKISTKDIFSRAKNNERLAKKIIGSAADILGMGTASLVNILDPEIIILGGKLSKQKYFIETAAKTARKHIFNKKAVYKFAISSLGNKANLLGAASLYK